MGTINEAALIRRARHPTPSLPTSEEFFGEDAIDRNVSASDLDSSLLPDGIFNRVPTGNRSRQSSPGR
jgi:hypothetical protein